MRVIYTIALAAILHHVVWAQFATIPTAQTQFKPAGSKAERNATTSATPSTSDEIIKFLQRELSLRIAQKKGTGLVLSVENKDPLFEKNGKIFIFKTTTRLANKNVITAHLTIDIPRAVFTLSPISNNNPNIQTLTIISRGVGAVKGKTYNPRKELLAVANDESGEGECYIYLKANSNNQDIINAFERLKTY